jgi:hypothetical protein
MSLAPMHRRAVSFWNLFERSAKTIDPAAAPAPDPIQVPPDIVRWLAQAMLLYGVPFEYLVPHPAMLPQESFRFFHIDQNWLLRLVEGAVSVGVGSSRDAIAILSQVDAVVSAAADRAVAVRAELRGKTPPEPDPVPTLVWTGFLLRSKVVSGWAGMEIAACDGADNPLTLLRIDRLSPTVLFCLIRGVPARIDLMEPPETLHFGVLHGQGGYYVVLRGLGAGGHEAGFQFTSTPVPTASIPTAAGSFAGVLDVNGAAANLKNALQAQGALSTRGTFTSCELAIQMVRAAGLQSFEPAVG